VAAAVTAIVTACFQAAYPNGAWPNFIGDFNQPKNNADGTLNPNYSTNNWATTNAYNKVFS
jgi:hypothetical protein